MDVLEKKEEWIRLLAYALSQETILRWEDNPVLRIISYESTGGMGELNFSDRFSNGFSGIDHVRIDEKRLLKIINSNENSYRAEIECKSAVLIPSDGKKLGNAYILCMSAHELLKLITTSDGLLRRNLFEDNVRDSQGYSTVNQEILTTLKTCPEYFVLFNNGITIVCRNVTIEHGKYVLENPQIVNGCQTCNMIYQAYRGGVKFKGVQIIAKIIGTDLTDVTQGIVRGANRQNIVYEEAFETIREFHKNIEKYFEVNQVKGYQKIYYERRSKQYAGNVQIRPYQKISFRGLIQSMVALFLNHVEDSHKHEYTLLKDYKDSLFVDGHSCQPYYLAAFLYLNVDVLFRGGKLPKELSSYKMHIMLLVKEMKGGVSPELSSNDIDRYCERLLNILQNNSLGQCALEACRKFDEIRTRWIALKGEQYKYGIKDSAEFRVFLMKEIHGVSNGYCNTDLLKALILLAISGIKKGARMGENLSKESLQQAIEENRVLVLPARIGQTVYHYHLTCFDGCLFQKRKFWDSFGHETGRCGTLPCHTRFHSIEEREVNLANIDWPFRTWGKSTFATHEEAKAAAHEKVKENITTLRGLGFKLDTNGYSVKSPDMLTWKVSGRNLRTLYIRAECMDDALAAARQRNPNYNTCQVRG